MFFSIASISKYLLVFIFVNSFMYVNLDLRLKSIFSIDALFENSFSDVVPTSRQLKTKNIISSESLKIKNCYVWFEVNTQKYVSDYLKYGNTWGEIGKPIITARISNVEIITKQIIKAGIPIISGFKTSDVFEDKPFHDFESWQEIARVARNISKLTNGRPVILENESTVTNMVANGVLSINYEKLRESIEAQQWPEIWFWYAPAGRREPLQSISYDIGRAIMGGIPLSRLIEASSAGFSSSHRNKVSKINLKRSIALDKNLISILYLDDDKKNYWPLDQVSQAVDLAIGEDVILYPGINDIEKGLPIISSLCNAD